MSEITTAQLTEGADSLTGVGVFDELMRASTAHLDKQFETGRIKGSDYANVYLGMMTALMQNATQFLLNQEKAGFEADLVAQQVTNALKEHEVLHSTKCKLDAEYDNLVEVKLKTIAETNLLGQKQVTETAQTSSTGVDADSVVGRQKALYLAQTNGFTRDAEQKAAKVMVEAFAVQASTDESIGGTATNKLDSTNIGRVVEKLITGVNA